METISGRSGHSPVLHKSLHGLGLGLCNMLLLSRLHSSALRSIWDVNARIGLAVMESCLLEVCASRRTLLSKNVKDDDF